MGKRPGQTPRAGGGDHIPSAAQTSPRPNWPQPCPHPGNEGQASMPVGGGLPLETLCAAGHSVRLLPLGCGTGLAWLWQGTGAFQWRPTEGSSMGSIPVGSAGPVVSFTAVGCIHSERQERSHQAWASPILPPDTSLGLGPPRGSAAAGGLKGGTTRVGMGTVASRQSRHWAGGNTEALPARPHARLPNSCKPKPSSPGSLTLTSEGPSRPPIVPPVWKLETDEKAENCPVTTPSGREGPVLAGRYVPPHREAQGGVIDSVVHSQTRRTDPAPWPGPACRRLS